MQVWFVALIDYKKISNNNFAGYKYILYISKT